MLKKKMCKKSQTCILTQWKKCLMQETINNYPKCKKMFSCVHNFFKGPFFIPRNHPRSCPKKCLNHLQVNRRVPSPFVQNWLARSYGWLSYKPAEVICPAEINSSLCSSWHTLLSIHLPSRATMHQIFRKKEERSP